MVAYLLMLVLTVPQPDGVNTLRLETKDQYSTMDACVRAGEQLVSENHQGYLCFPVPLPNQG